MSVILKKTFFSMCLSSVHIDRVIPYLKWKDSFLNNGLCDIFRSIFVDLMKPLVYKIH